MTARLALLSALLACATAFTPPVPVSRRSARPRTAMAATAAGPVILVGGRAQALAAAYAAAGGGGVLASAAAVASASPLDVLAVDQDSDAALSAIGVDPGRAVHVIGSGDASSPSCGAAAAWDLWLPPSETGAEPAAVDQLSRLLALSARPRASPEDARLEAGHNTFFLSLTFGDVAAGVESVDWADVTSGVDLIELRVDMLDRADADGARAAVSALRRATDLPILYTVRSAGQCGKHPDDDVDGLFSLYGVGLRAGVEWLDIESNWGEDRCGPAIDTARRQYPCTRLLGSWHVVGRHTQAAEIDSLFDACAFGGRVDGAKVVTTAYSHADALRVIERSAAASARHDDMPCVALCLGKEGALSRVLNSRFTPVTHPALAIAAPGQLSAKEIMRLRAETGVVPRRQFALVGSPISASPSPAMHNAAFETLQLPHHYGLCEDEGLESFEALVAAKDFGGCSVTIPHKRAVMPYLDELDPSASAIGAVNTIVVRGDGGEHGRRLVGHNTDWIGIRAPVARRLRERAASGTAASSGHALVVGAGGTARAACYALQSLGLKVSVHNRTPANAAEVAEHFGAATADSLEDTDLAFDAIVSTVPAAVGFTLPAKILAARPVLLDAAYKPPLTALLTQASEAGCYCVQGAEMLFEQAIAQSELWLERPAPRGCFESAVWGEVEKLF